MRIAWLSSPSDNEFDLTTAIARSSDVQLSLFVITDNQDKNHDYHMSLLTKANNIEIIQVPHDENSVNGICRIIKNLKFDLIILRHPVWIFNQARAREIFNIFYDQPVVIWTWEWEPNIEMRQMPPLDPWHRIAVTNYNDFDRCKAKYPDKQVYYLPFGAVQRRDDEINLITQEFEADLVCDAQPHYECHEFRSIKKASVDQMIVPCLDLDIALWGSRYGTTDKCDWAWTEMFRMKHRGHYETYRYPQVYASSKIYLGVSWNWHTGGYSIRLPRALSCGILVVWHETLKWQREIPEYPVVIWSRSPSETREIVDYYLSHEAQRDQIAAAGRKFVNENWEWSKLLKDLAGKIQ